MPIPRPTQTMWTLLLAALLATACSNQLPGNACPGGKCDSPDDVADAGTSVAAAIRINPATATLAPTESVTLRVTLADSSGNMVSTSATPTFATTDDVVTVVNGVVTAQKAGTATIAISLGGFSGNATITVTETQQTDPNAATAACCGLASDPNGPNDNICDVPPNTAACPPTKPGGYCDPDGDASYEGGDWVKGYYDWQALCGEVDNAPGPATAACCDLADDPIGPDDNICDVPPNTAACAPTKPGGYCDPDGDSSYEGGNWVKGYEDWQTLCE